MPVPQPTMPTGTTAAAYHAVTVDGVEVFYREAGPRDAPTVLLLHAYPTSSHMYRDLIPALADRYHAVAPDFPGFGRSDMPPRAQFGYTFAHLADVTDGWLRPGARARALRALRHGLRRPGRLPPRAQAPGAGVRPRSRTATRTPRGWALLGPPQALLGERRGGRPRQPARTAHARRHEVAVPARAAHRRRLGAREPRRVHARPALPRPAGQRRGAARLFYDYRTNVALYPAFQAYFRRHQPPTLLVWGKHDQIFPAQGAEPYKRDLHTLEYHLLDTGHFALETHGPEIAHLMRDFLDRHVARGAAAPLR